MTDLLDEALARFHQLLAAAIAAGEPEPTAMTVASAAADGRVSARTVLLKDADRAGFVFYTNYGSNKGRQLQSHPQCALLFLWKQLPVAPEPDAAAAAEARQVQVKVEGIAVPVGAAEADAYFASRPRQSQLGAWASSQSQPLGSRQELVERLAALERQYDGLDVPRPPYWSGFRVEPRMIELWFGMPYRLHQRERYELGTAGWGKQLLYP